MKKIITLASLLLFVLVGLAQETGDRSGQKAGENMKLSRFPGGEDSLKCFLAKNLDPGIVSVKNLKPGSVYLSFTVGDNGRTSEITIITSYSRAVDEEIVRVISLMTAWIPAEQLVGYPKGRWVKVPSNYELSVTVPFHDQCPGKKKEK